MTEFVKPKTDLVFKKFFASDDNRDLLKDFISAVLDIPTEDIRELIVENPEISPEELNEKFVIIDLKITLNNDKLLHMEMQLFGHRRFRERVLYYWAKIYGNQLKTGETYTAIKDTISIVITDFNLFQTKDFHSVFTMADLKHNEILTDTCKIHFFELSKLENVVDEGNKLVSWLRLLDAESEVDLNMLAGVDNPAIQKGINVIRNYNSDAEIRRLAFVRERALRDEASLLEDSRNDGIAKGRTELSKEIALKLIRRGFNDDEIIDYIGITRDELERIKSGKV